MTCGSISKIPGQKEIPDRFDLITKDSWYALDQMEKIAKICWNLWASPGKYVEAFPRHEELADLICHSRKGTGCLRDLILMI